MTFWIVVLVVGAATIAFKASGPVLLGRKPLGPRVQSVVDLLAPVMLAALVVTQMLGGDEEIVIDARVPGVAAAAVAIWRGVPLIVAMVIAGLVTALLRAAGGELGLASRHARAPEHRDTADCLGDEAEQADQEEPQSKVPHTSGDRMQQTRA